MTIKYCIQHEKEVLVVEIAGGVKVHTFDTFPDQGMHDVTACDGPFAECPPPEMTEEQWDIALETDYTVYEDDNPEPCPCQHGMYSPFCEICDEDYVI